jgi:hypothetical protein
LIGGSAERCASNEHGVLEHAQRLQLQIEQEKTGTQYSSFEFQARGMSGILYGRYVLLSNLRKSARRVLLPASTHNTIQCFSSLSMHKVCIV